ncbi:MAG TPA: ATP-binding cassette domain-containing protein [Pyrinomonadaceae bacterium]|nr:ATP-binding cassette domain-containing protein [Pyrinomonadaceae bacterium]
MSSPKRTLGVRNWEPPSQSVSAARGPLEVRLSRHHGGTSSSKFLVEVEFQVTSGVTVIVGHSGAGKTTILRCIAGLCDPQEGRIAIGERLLFDSTQRVKVESARRCVGFVFQDLALFPHLSVQDNVAYGLRRLDDVERQRRMREVLEAFQIAHLCKRFPREISGGEQQRVALARSLVTEPAVLLLDEPLSSLDPRTKASIIEDLRRWNDARRIPILYVTHDYEEVLALGDRVIALDQGRIEAEGVPRELIPALRREQLAAPSNFENLFDATVVAHSDHEHTMMCQITGTSIQIETPMAAVRLDSEVRIGIRADEILVASSQPEIVGECNVIRGKVKVLERIGANVEARVEGGGEFRVRLSARSVEASKLAVTSEVWMMIRAHACHLVSPALSRTLRRVFVFVCSGNTSRSPMAQAICNDAIAKRLGVPLEALESFGIKAVSAGLNARPGEPLTAEADQALSAIGLATIEHRSANLTHGLAQRAEVIFCMTGEQQRALTVMFPEAASKIHCLQAPGDIDDPNGKGMGAYLDCARRLQDLIRMRLDQLIPPIDPLVRNT